MLIYSSKCQQRSQERKVMSENITRADEPLFEKLRSFSVDEIRAAITNPEKKSSFLKENGISDLDLDRYLNAKRESVILAQHSCC